MQIFDRALLARRRSRAALGFAGADFLKRALAESVADRIADVPRRFACALDLGCHSGFPLPLPAQTVVSSDLSPAFVRSAPGLRVAADEEALPFADNSFDLVLSAGSLHWVNDLPGALIQINRAMQPDGFFVAALLGGETLRELRSCLLEAEAELSDGAAPRVSPMLDVRDAGALLQRAGFAMPVADADTLSVEYRSPLALLDDLRAMGETNVLVQRSRTPLRRAVLARMAALYAARYPAPDGRVRATFQVITLSGWSPAPGQPRPLPRGSAKTRLADALGVRETPLER
jgi:NADH dehydrogenase [ubiquinone] 1 alpha subcomplex assembly factor 5